MSTPARDPSTKPPVMFIHGLWLHSSSWFPWIEAFEEAGYEASAPGWPDEADTVDAARAEPDAQAGHGIDDVVGHYTALVAALDRAPVLIGHSFGGTIVERLLGGGVGTAGIAIDAAPIKGVLPVPISALRSAFPVLKSPSNAHKTVSLTAEQFRYAFGNTLPADESDELWQRWAIPAPGRPIFQSATANFSPHSEAKVDTHNDSRGPLLLVAGGKDHTVPEKITESTLKQYKHTTATTEMISFPDRGHSLVIDHGWREIADACIAWLDGQQL
jgi:pimeloyl-ACP methyl ester carboxylesterase